MIPVTINLPWDPARIALRGRKDVYNEHQIQYFKSLIKALHSMYSDIAEEINQIDLESVLESTTVVCHNDEVVCHNNEVIEA